MLLKYTNQYIIDKQVMPKKHKNFIKKIREEEQKNSF